MKNPLLGSTSPSPVVLHYVMLEALRATSTMSALENKLTDSSPQFTHLRVASQAARLGLQDLHSQHVSLVIRDRTAFNSDLTLDGRRAQIGLLLPIGCPSFLPTCGGHI